MTEQIEAVLAQMEAYDMAGPEGAEGFRRLFTARKGAIPALMEGLKGVAPEARATVGKRLNELKARAQERLDAAEAARASQARPKNQPEDLTLPGHAEFVGGRHPLAIVQRRIVGIFERMGFAVADGPEIEDDWHNFTALNFAAGHPARDMQDTFFIEKGAREMLLRTHTSSVQVRAMEAQAPPLRLLMPGRVYRNEAISARAHCFFHQVEGLAVDEGLSFADLKQTLLGFVRALFGPDTQIRLRPSYFPFTEISAEMDISCLICKQAGCGVCKHSGWVEIMGCGMVDPAVLENCGIDPGRYSGYAFGMGVERIAQLLFRVPDLRLYSQNDVRFLAQFQGLRD